MELEPGPFWNATPMPLGKRVATPHLFERLVDELAPTLRSSDDGLASRAADVGRDVPTDLAAHYQATIGVAEAVHATQSGAEDVLTAGRLIDSGAGAEAYRAASLPYLPQPNAPIDVDFSDPPSPPNPGDPPDDRDPYERRV